MATKILIYTSEVREIDWLYQYFFIKEIDHDTLPPKKDRNGVPLIDMIRHKLKGHEEANIFLGVKNLRDLYEERSEYGGTFLDFIKKGRHKIISCGGDTLLVPLQAAGLPFGAWLNELGMTVLGDGRAGKFLKETYPNLEWVHLLNPYEDPYFSYPYLDFLRDHNPTKDFLLLTCNYAHTRHRKALYDRLVEKNLIEGSIVRFSENREAVDKIQNSDFSERIKQTFDGWMDGVPPVGLYNDTCLEVIAETFGGHQQDDSFFMTEKTTRPISMRHPFMVVSNVGFLKHLRDLGFKTFGEHIDESYDQLDDLESRINVIIDNIITLKGKYKKFYSETKQIRDHNFYHLQNLQGQFNTKVLGNFDKFWKQLKKGDIK